MSLSDKEFKTTDYYNQVQAFKEEDVKESVVKLMNLLDSCVHDLDDGKNYDWVSREDIIDIFGKELCGEADI